LRRFTDRYFHQGKENKSSEAKEFQCAKGDASAARYQPFSFAVYYFHQTNVQISASNHDYNIYEQPIVDKPVNNIIFQLIQQ
jgi:hypothetical protein